MPEDTHDAAEESVQGVLKTSESTGFFLWLLITVSAGIIMAQDSWVSLQQPRLSTVDATAAFTKVLVIHSLWLVATLLFIGFTAWVKPTSAWKIHLVVGALTLAWTVGVLAWSFSDVERLHVTTWRCESSPTETIVTDEFLNSCTPADMSTTIRLGGDIFLWSADDEHFWRWIVPGEGMSTLQTRWPSSVLAMYLASDEPGTVLTAGSMDSIPGGNWSARFEPGESRNLHIYYVEFTPDTPEQRSTPPTDSRVPTDTGRILHERSQPGTRQTH